MRRTAFRGFDRANASGGTVLLFAAVAGLSLAARVVLLPPAAQSAEPRSAMHAIFDSVSELWPLMLDDERYLSETGQAQARAYIDRLVDATDVLEAHAKSRDADFRFLARSLGTDFREAQERIELGRDEEARFFIAAAVQNCVLCHSRLPKARDFPLASRLNEKTPIQQMDPGERAIYQVATRSFDAAMTSWETHFADPGFKPTLLRAEPELEEYLRVAIAVQREPERARATLLKLMMRPDTAPHLRTLLSTWATELQRRGPEIRGPATLEHVRRLLGPVGEEEDPSTPDAERRIGDLVAQGLVLRLIDATAWNETNALELGEAYYWLGVIEARSVDSFWHPQKDFHLELAIRMAPGAGYAEDAYRRYADSIALGWSGSSGTNIPASEVRKLDELREEIDRANPDPG